MKLDIVIVVTKFTISKIISTNEKIIDFGRKGICLLFSISLQFTHKLRNYSDQMYKSIKSSKKMYTENTSTLEQQQNRIFWLVDHAYRATLQFYNINSSECLPSFCLNFHKNFSRVTQKRQIRIIYQHVGDQLAIAG